MNVGALVKVALPHVKTVGKFIAKEVAIKGMQMAKEKLEEKNKKEEKVNK